MNTDTTTFYTFKHLFTKGIEKVQGTMNLPPGYRSGILYTRTWDKKTGDWEKLYPCFPRFIEEKYVAQSLEEALEKARSMQEERLASLDNQIAKLESREWIEEIQKGL